MSTPSSLEHLVGEWQGANRVWLEPGAKPLECETTATVRFRAQGKFFELAYDWAEGGPQDGLLVLGHEDEEPNVTAFWIDSWHMDSTFMTCKGEALPDGSVTVVGSYAAPPEPDWGWRITVVPVDEASFKLVMHNITPDGEEALAVEAVYVRQ